MDSNTTSGADASTGSRIRYLRHPVLLLTRAADEERNLLRSSSRHPGAAVARKTRAIGRELSRTVTTLLLASLFLPERLARLVERVTARQAYIAQRTPVHQRECPAIAQALPPNVEQSERPAQMRCRPLALSHGRLRRQCHCRRGHGTLPALAANVPRSATLGALSARNTASAISTARNNVTAISVARLVGAR